MAVGVLTPGRGDGFMDKMTFPCLSLPKPSPTYMASLATSLPPLPDYPLPEKFRRYWGQDKEVEDRLGIPKAAFTKFRYNYDCCTPDADVYNMMPKPRKITYNITDFKYKEKINTSRRVPRDSTCQVFPINNPLRKTSDGQHVLTNQTRQALDDYTTSLYRTSRNKQIYKDLTHCMKLRMERDAQFATECPAVPDQTCQRILNITPPCPICRGGGINFDINADNTGANVCKCKENLNTYKDQSDMLENFHKTENSTTTDVQEDTEGIWRHENADDTCRCELCTTQQHVLDKYKDRPEELDLETNKPDTNIDDKKPMEYFGPWSVADGLKCHGLPTEQDDLLLPHSYNYKYPSSVQCRCVQNDNGLQPLGQDGKVRYCSVHPDFFQPAVLLCRRPLEEKPVLVETKDDDKIEAGVNNEIADKNQRNRWTFRDENNLRRPCVSRIIGTLNKSHSNKRFHSEHPEVVPDLRDNRRTHRRVKFYGYNSFVFR